MSLTESKLTSAQEQCLRDQVITADRPGPVLRDFRMLLDFVGPEGVEVGGKHHLLPMKFIGELDRRLSRPLHLELKRPQLRSHPYLQGLNLLLRASCLSRVEGSGTRTRLVLAPALMAQWDQFNPTEQFFHLLEAWLRIGRAEMVGERSTLWGDLLFPCLQSWKLLPREGRRFDPQKPYDFYMIGIGRESYLLALLDLFGLMEVQPPPRPIAPWTPARVGHVPFGDAVLTLLAASEYDFVFSEDDPSEEDEDREESPEEEDEDLEDEAPDEPRFGIWQPLFQPYFPDYRTVLEIPRSEPRQGEFVFRVSLGPVWRRIAMPAEATLHDLVSMILRSVKFDNDHLYEITYRNRLGARISALHPFMDEGPWADQVPIGTLPLEPGQSMELVYDFGDNWEFTVKLERIDPPAAKSKGPRILESHGQAPQQYRSWDE